MNRQELIEAVSRIMDLPPKAIEAHLAGDHKRALAITLEEEGYTEDQVIEETNMENLNNLEQISDAILKVGTGLRSTTKYLQNKAYQKQAAKKAETSE